MDDILDWYWYDLLKIYLFKMNSKLLWKENLDSLLFFTMAFANYGNFTINMQGDWRFEIVVNISSAVVVFFRLVLFLNIYLLMKILFVRFTIHVFWLLIVLIVICQKFDIHVLRIVWKCLKILGSIFKNISCFFFICLTKTGAHCSTYKFSALLKL